ncbi:hypothetical protein FBU30_001294 [Linnemannia zychae]|nr:hypothetical protein FBU30_001294 [Linnemannia zychae]
MIELVQENNTVSGVVIEQNGVRRTIRARKGVILGSGGFDHNIEMRKEYQQQLVSSHSSLGARDNTGDGICAGLKIGAATNFMDESWWVPIIPLPDGPYFCISERTLPGSLMVNKHGMRFVNEAAQSCHIINMMYEQDRSEDGSEIPIWMIADQVFRDRYLFRTIPGRFPLPKKWYDAGVVKKSNSLQELAQEIRLPVDTLQTTVENFNEYAKNGVDLDFGRGGYAVNHVYGDPGNKPNSTLGPLRKGPFYAFKMVSGDFGTRGGIVTDANARALRSDGTVIKGLWAAGTTSSPAIGRAYPGPGTPIRSSLTSGYIAGNSIADS